MHLQMTYFAGKMPHIELLTEADATIVRSDIPDDMFNYVLSTQFSEENAHSRIQHVISLFQERHLPFSWWVGPLDTPDDLAEKLIGNGFTFKEIDVGMVLELETYDAQSASLLHFEHVGNAKALMDFGTIIQAIGGHPEAYERIYKHIPLTLLQEGAPLELHIAYLDE
jgi:hypothetical protein